MILKVIGISHRSAPIDVREKLALTLEKAAYISRTLVDRKLVTEALILSTCNRTEIYYLNNVDLLTNQGDDVEQLNILKEVCYQLSLDGSFSLLILDYVYCYQDIKAIEHLMLVACGIDSMVMGETEIFGQLKKAYFYCRRVNSTGKVLNKLVERTFHVTKTIRNNTNLCSKPVSIAYSAICLSKHIFSDFKKLKVMLVGASPMNKICAEHFKELGVDDISILNRTIENAEKLAAPLGLKVGPLSNIVELLKEVDIVVTSTSCQEYLISYEMIKNLIKSRRSKTLFMVDLSVPRDIDPRVKEFLDIYHYCIDDLESIVASNISLRQESALKAKDIIVIEALNFRKWFKGIFKEKFISDYRGRCHSLKEKEITRALIEIKNGKDPSKVIQSLAYNLTNKLIHEPTIEIRNIKVSSLDQLSNLEQLLNKSTFDDSLDDKKVKVKDLQSADLDSIE